MENAEAGQEKLKISCVEMTCEGRTLDHHLGDPGCSYEVVVEVRTAAWVLRGDPYDERLSDEALNGPRVEPSAPFSLSGEPQA